MEPPFFHVKATAFATQCPKKERRMSNATAPSVLPQKYSNTFSAVLQYF
ncbi:MAG: hypothetical protein K2H04_02920 [Bacteroidaceae bacterium]|nr:hypothetical protein [Bacteroidaceae bacterium]